MSVIDEWMSVLDEWMSVLDEWMSVDDEWMDVLIGWMNEWIWWVNAVNAVSVCNDMNVECVWRMLGECMCDRLPKISVLRYLCKLLCVTIYNILYKYFQNNLSNCQTIIWKP